MVTPMQQPQEGEVRRNRRTGATATYRGGQWFEEAAPPQSPQGQPGIPRVVPMETPQQRVQAEERQYDRERDTVRDQLTASREQRAIEAAARQAEAAEIANERLTEDQGKAGGYAQLMADAEQSYQQALREGFNPTGFRAGLANFTDNIPLMGGVGNFIRDDAGDRARQAELQWSDAQLKAMSGAASPEPEVVRNQITNFARPGQNYDYIGERLEDARRTAFESARRRAGRDLQGLAYPDTDAGQLPIRDLNPDETPEALAASGRVRGADGVWRYPRDDQGNPIFPNEAPGAGPDNGPPNGGDNGGLLPVEQRGGGGAGQVLGGAAAFQRSATERFPFAERGLAAFAGLMSGQGYDRMRQAQGALRDYDRENNGFERNMGGIAGVASQIPLGANAGRWIAGGPNLAYQATRGTAIGVPTGAVFGASDAPDGQEAQGARSGAIVGGLTGGIAPPLARVVGGMTNALTRPIREGVGDIFQRLGGRAMTGEDRAVRTMMRGTNPDEMAARLDEGRRYGADLTAADVGGSNVQGRVRVAATRQTPGREVAQDFAAGRRSEVQDFAAGLGERVSPLAATPGQLDEALEGYQRSASAEAFGAVRGDRVTLNRDSIMALRSEEGRAAVRDAARLYASSTDEAERNVAAELNRLADLALDNPGNVEVTVGAADLMARHLAKAGGMDANRNRVFGSLGRTIRDDARTQNAGYDEALTGYAARARLGDAVETGERFLGRGHTGDFVEAAGGMDDAQRGIARAAARASIERASETGGSAPGLLDKLATGRGQQARSVALLGPDDAADLQQGARVGRRMVDTGNNVNPRAGSNTFLNTEDGAARGAGSVVGNLFGGRPLQAIGGVVDMIRSVGISDEQAEIIVRLATDPSRTEDVLQILRTRFPEQEARRIVSELTPVIAGQAGAASAPQARLMTGPRP